VNLTVVADQNIPAAERYFSGVGRVERVNGRTLAAAQLARADILLVRSVTRVDEALLAGSAVKFVGTATSGFDHIDRDYLARKGIGFAHAPGANANSVVEYVLSAIGAVGDFLERLLVGGSVGIVGYGHIGRALAARLRALGIGFRIYDPWLDQDEIPCAADLQAVLQCDVVSLHPELCLTPPWPSHHLLGDRELAWLPPGALLINASRGPVVDNAALRARLEYARQPLAVLDVWEGEPVIDAGLLARVALGTAHIAGYSLDGKLLATRMLADAVKAFLREAAARGDTVRADPEAGPGSAQGAARVQLPAHLSNASAVRFLLASAYDIRLDDALLRESVEVHAGTAGRAQAFDELRRSYRDRRELAGSVVDVAAGVAPAQVALVRALGCTPVVQGKPL